MNTKSKVLTLLEDNQGKYISGEEIADALGLSRASVWKVIRELQAGGHRIAAATNKGYMLEASDDVLTAEGILKNLARDSKLTKIICLDSVDSTNNYAKKIALEGAAHGTLITADVQTAGRGRHGHTFESPANTGLYMTLILRPKIEISKFQMITIADAVAVCLAIEELYEGARGKIFIKWVNDIYFEGKKITGILTEAVTNFESGEIESVVTGIGINIATKNFTPAAGDKAGSIFDDDGDRVFTRNKLCARVADHIMNFAEDLNAPGLIAAYRERSLLTGKDITYMKDERKYSAHVEGIDDSGGLIVLNEHNEREIFRSGEVSLIRN